MADTATEPVARCLVRQILQRDRAVQLEKELHSAIDELDAIHGLLSDIRDASPQGELPHALKCIEVCADDAETALAHALDLHTSR